MRFVVRFKLCLFGGKVLSQIDALLSEAGSVAFLSGSLKAFSQIVRLVFIFFHFSTNFSCCFIAVTRS